jgi:hypothetical protein
MEDVAICGHLVNYPAIWHILWPFGIFYPVLVHFTRFGMLYQEKSGNPALKQNMPKSFPRFRCHDDRNIITKKYVAGSFEIRF